MVLKVIQTVIVLSIFVVSAKSQSYIPYYQLQNDADQRIAKKDWQKAIENLTKAFSLVDYVHAKQYAKAAMCASQLKEYDKAYLYAKKAVLGGYSQEFWEANRFKNFRKSTYFQEFLDSLFIFEKIHESLVNVEYQKAIDTLHYIDQTIIRNQIPFRGKFRPNNLVIPKNRYELDSVVFDRLLALIDEYGFPSEQRVGYHGASKVWVIFHHNVRLKQNHEYIPMLKEAVKKGEFLPREFSQMYDQSRMIINEKPAYAPIDEDQSAENLNRINNNRAEIGLPTLDSFKIKNKGKVFEIEKN